MEKIKITWKRSHSGTTSEGFIGSIRLFYVGRSDVKQGGEQPYRVRTDLPGMQKMANGRQYRTLADAQKRCESLFDKFFDHLQNNRFPGMSWES